MGRKKKTIHEEVNEILDIVNVDCINLFFKELYYLFELFDVDEKDDWVEKLVGKDNVREVRLIRACYIVSRMAEHFSSKFCSVKAHHPNFWKRLQQYVEDEKLLMEEFEIVEGATAPSTQAAVTVVELEPQAPTVASLQAVAEVEAAFDSALSLVRT